jgi:hypothetical protein
MVEELHAPRLRPDVRFRRVADEGIVLCQKAGDVLVVNEVGARIVELLGSGTNLPDVLARLEEEFDAEPGRLASDLDGFVHELRVAGVIEEGGAG